MERHLGEHEYFVGERPRSLMSPYVYPRLCPEGGYDLGAFPAVRAWLERIASPPWVRATARLGRYGYIARREHRHKHGGEGGKGNLHCPG